MAGLAFLLIYATVFLGHFRVRRQTGANPRWLAAGVTATAGLFALLLGYTIDNAPAGTPITLLVALAGSLASEFIYRRRTGRTFAPRRPDRLTP